MSQLPQNVAEILETVDVLKLVMQRGRQELHGFSWYMIVWGLYSAINLAATVFWNLDLWIWLLFVAFFVTTIPVAGLLWSLVAWGLSGALTYAAWTLSHHGGLVLLAIVLTASLSYLGLYHLAIRQGRYRPLPFRVALAPRISWGWGVVMAGMALVFGNLARIVPDPHLGTLSLTLWGYALGVGLFLSGLLHPGFFLLGVAAIFGIPLATFANPLLGTWAFILIALAMAGFGVYLRLRTA